MDRQRKSIREVLGHSERHVNHVSAVRYDISLFLNPLMPKRSPFDE